MLDVTQASRGVEFECRLVASPPHPSNWSSAYVLGPSRRHGTWAGRRQRWGCLPWVFTGTHPPKAPWRFCVGELGVKGGGPRARGR